MFATSITLLYVLKLYAACPPGKDFRVVPLKDYADFILEMCVRGSTAKE